ncbi:formate dehydrogenase (NAD+) [Tilletia horrida]|uniref:Formate dehydrogenase n=1 Tax=Tilletia horrida TaxID=155126 RepID=A0AAN6GPX7_9BASI|nr:formate dehydrogenase (NAD+) [Tilletia horrida]KAK0565968.1 formate dehydrogenase (NAD+) [Tilletia horrida]
MKILAVLYDGGKQAEEPRLLGSVQNALGLRKWLESEGHTYVVTSDKEGPNSEFAKEIKDSDVVISTPFHPIYLTKELLATAPKLKLALTAGVGSDHVDLDAANEHRLTVAEVTGSNVVSVAEHVMLTILALVRNYNAGHAEYLEGGWDIAKVARDSFDLEGKVVGTLGAGRIGFRVLQRLKPFDCKELLYYDYTPLPEQAAKEVGARRVEDLKEFVSQLDVLTVNAPLHDGTRGLVNKELISHMKKGAWIVNTARGAICVAEDIKEAVQSGRIRGYGGDVSYPQPAPADHPWRSMEGVRPGIGNAMTVHYSGTTLDAQERYAAGTRENLERWFKGEAMEPANVIVADGDYVTKAYGQRTKK